MKQHFKEQEINISVPNRSNFVLLASNDPEKNESVKRALWALENNINSDRYEDCLMYHPAYSEDGRKDKGLEALNHSICTMIAKRTGKSEDYIWSIMNRGRVHL